MDFLIRHATIADGTGSPLYRADIAISNGMITEIGPDLRAPGAEIIDADQCLVTPGFVDVHTHYDGQVTWDDALEPSASHGITTLIMGNCGVGFAPMKGRDREALIDLMEGVEDIPGTALAEGMPEGSWETFPEYLDFLGRRSYAMDVGAHLPHGALRFYVMGERGARNEEATAEDLAAMTSLTRQAMDAGALGLSTSRTAFHRSRSADEPMPGTYASAEEIAALVEAVAASGRGVIEMIPSGATGEGGGTLNEYSNPLAEATFFGELSKRTGVPVTFTTAQVPGDPGYWRDVLSYTAAANMDGARLRPQIAARAATILHGLAGYHMFTHRPTYQAIAHLDLSARVAEMRKPEIRQAILSETDMPMSVPVQIINDIFRRALVEPTLFPMGTPVDYEPAADASVAARINRCGRSPEAVVYDTLLEDDGCAFYMNLSANYVDGNLDAVGEMIRDPATIIGLGDAGAHVTFICDASNTTFALSHWARRRSRGPQLPIEAVVAKLTSVNADLYGLRDRGRIAVGMRADVNVIDLDRLAVMPPRMVYDLPSGGGRLVQDATGYVATFVAGEMTRRNDADTGRRPGRILRQHSQALH